MSGDGGFLRTGKLRAERFSSAALRKRGAALSLALRCRAGHADHLAGRGLREVADADTLRGLMPAGAAGLPSAPPMTIVAPVGRRTSTVGIDRPPAAAPRSARAM
jgi:hypothetical protein